MVIFLMNLIKGSLQDELDYFFKIINNMEIWARAVTKGGVTKARKKINYTAFLELNKEAVDLFYKSFPTNTWNGFRLLAIDGSTVQLENVDDIVEKWFFAVLCGQGWFRQPACKLAWPEPASRASLAMLGASRP